MKVKIRLNRTRLNTGVELVMRVSLPPLIFGRSRCSQSQFRLLNRNMVALLAQATLSALNFSCLAAFFGHRVNRPANLQALNRWFPTDYVRRH
jgi:hypothetical protein